MGRTSSDLAAAQPIQLEARALREHFADAFVARPRIYWLDLLASAGIGWSAFVASGLLVGSASWLVLAGAVLALYRAALFIHEIPHLRPACVPGLEPVWNALVGFPLMVPSLMYWSHSDHHKRSLYGTELDPEYEPIAYWSPLRIAGSIGLMAIFPGVMALRWGVVGPLSWLVRPLRPWVIARLSTLVINPAYRRRAPSGQAARRWLLQELGTALCFWIGIALLASRTLGIDWALRWYAVTASILVINQLRTLGAHRYENRGGQLDGVGQLVDSVNLRGLPIVTALLAPVGLRYHALHHLLPTLPYHSLGRVHRRLMAELPHVSPYRQAEEPALATALCSLLATAAENARSHSQRGVAS